MKRYSDIVAVVPLGGGGRRLYPVTIDQPKHVLPLCDAPILHSSMKHYVSQEVAKYILGSTGFENGLGSLSVFGSGGRYETPSGRNVSVFHTSYDDAVFANKGSADVLLWTLENYSRVTKGNHILLINGDNLSTIDLRDMYKFHADNGALLTIAVKGFEPDDPKLKSLGTVVFDDTTKRVTDFVEKSPSPVSRYANTAILLFSPEIVDFVKTKTFIDAVRDRQPRGRLDVGKHFIPSIVDLDAGVYAYTLNPGIKWSDVGTPGSYSVTTLDALKGEYDRRYGEHGKPDISFLSDAYEQIGNARVHKNTVNLMGKKALGRVRFNGNCIVGGSVIIGEGTEITDSVIGVGCNVGRNVKINGVTTLLPGTIIGDNAELNNTITGYKSTIGSKSDIGSGSVIGGRVVIPDSMKIGVDWRIAIDQHRKLVLEQDTPDFRLVRELGDLGAFLFEPV